MNDNKKDTTTFTVTLKGNRDFCEAESLMFQTTVKCPCNSDDNCKSCHGKGRTSLTKYPFELPVHGQLFNYLWNAFEIPVSAYGKINPRKLLSLIKKWEESPEDMDIEGMDIDMEDDEEEENDKECPIETLKKICEEGIKREENIMWFKG